jgi:mannan endo-1,4-beta-mannosidase
MLTLGKPFAFTEIGPATTPAAGATGSFDYQSWSQAIRDRFPATSYFLAWNDGWSPIRNQHAAEFMNDRWVVNRGEIVRSALTTAAGTPVGGGPTTLLAGFESGTKEGWGGYNIKAGPWAVTEWASHGNWSLKADVDLSLGNSYLNASAMNLSGYREVSAFVRTAPWGNHATGTTAKLYVRTAAVDWRDSGSAVVGPDGVTLTLSLEGIPDLASVRELGVTFAPAAGASGGSAVYLDNLTATGSARLLWGFESGTVEGWQGGNITAGPWAVTEWSSQGVRSLKADVDLTSGENHLYTLAGTDLRGYTSLSVRVRTAPWGYQANGSTAKLYVKTGAGFAWRDSGSTLTGPDGVTLTLNLAGNNDLGDIREVGVYIQPATTASGGSAIYVDDIQAQ